MKVMGFGIVNKPSLRLLLHIVRLKWAAVIEDFFEGSFQKGSGGQLASHDVEDDGKNQTRAAASPILNSVIMK